MSSYRLLSVALLCLALTAQAEEGAAPATASESAAEPSAAVPSPETASAPETAAPAPEAAQPAPAPAPENAAPESPRIDIRMPARGMTMDEVEKQFGTPGLKRPAVGEPPITRWVYADYTVYFERQYVIHTVLNERPSTP